MTELAILAFLGSLPMAFAINAASRDGARGPLGYCVHFMESAADWLIRQARWLRKFHAWREGR